MKQLSLTETAKAVRQTLKITFPRTKFSVRSKGYSGGSSIHVDWTDGPRWSEVNDILRTFAGAGFDGMTDCKYYYGPSEYKGDLVEFGVDFVHGQRTESPDLLRVAAYKVHRETKLPLLNVTISKWGSGYFEEGSERVPFSYRPSNRNDDGKGWICNDSQGEWYRDLVYQVARDIATDGEAAKPEIPELVNDSLIDERVKPLIDSL